MFFPPAKLLHSAVIAATLLHAPVPAWAQPQAAASPVRYTEAREHFIQGQLQLPGSVEANTVSLVASEIAGLVIEYPVTEGLTVEKGRLLARLNTRSLEIRLTAADAQLKEATARLKLAERNLQRSNELFTAGIISRQQLDDSFYEFNAWQGRIDALNAEIEHIRHDIGCSRIHAPFNGVVTSKHTELGQWVGVGGPVVELLSLEDLDILVNVPEQHLRVLRVGGPASVRFETLPGVSAAGKIGVIMPRADPQARTFPVKVRVSGLAGKAAVGMLAEVTLPSGGRQRATVVPKDAVVDAGAEKVVYLLNGDNTVQPATVQTGSGVGDWIEVRGPLAAGQRVVTRGNERLRPGQLVRGEPIEYALP